jgi:hypothetical protein
MLAQVSHFLRLNSRYALKKALSNVILRAAKDLASNIQTMLVPQILRAAKDDMCKLQWDALSYGEHANAGGYCIFDCTPDGVGDGGMLIKRFAAVVTCHGAERCC